jgi:NADH-quinone oxidoreductase subunit N
MYPIIFLSITGLLTLFLGFLKNRALILPLSILFLIVGLGLNFLDWNAPGLYFSEMLEISNHLIIVQSILIISAALILGLGFGLFSDLDSHPAEYFAIIQLTLVGALIMVSFQNLLMLFVGLEILSLGLYVLTGSDKRNLRGNEAAIKYFLMGSFATGILLFGIAMYYGASGSFNIHSTINLAGAKFEGKIFFYISILFVLIGLLFKVSAAPFHFWTADVYQGAPTLFTAYMATIVKTAGFFAIYRLFSTAFSFEYDLWVNIIVGAIILSLLIGNVTAVFQSSFKRMLAFSSVSQAGFMLFSIIGLGVNSASSLGFYSASYALATVTAFGVLLIVSGSHLENGRPNENIEAFNGLFKKSPLLAVVLMVSMLSLSGIPLTSGFWGKFFVFNDAASKGFLWLLVFAVIMSAVSIYYYFKPVRASFSNKSVQEGEIELSAATKYTLILSTVLTILLGIAPQLLKGIL